MTTEAQVRSYGSRSDFYGTQSGTEVGVSPSTSVFSADLYSHSIAYFFIYSPKNGQRT
jgi:hypothetical protein